MDRGLRRVGGIGREVEVGEGDGETIGATTRTTPPPARVRWPVANGIDAVYSSNGRSMGERRTREEGREKSWRGARLYTVGHSTRSFGALVELLRAFSVSVLVDIRTIPRSRHNPQFDGDSLRAALRSRRIRYVHLRELGGLRHARADSPNSGWRNASFRGYADYMLTEGFELGLEKLRSLAAEKNVALMCAEAVPWRCHRSLVADALSARGAEVLHITGVKRATPHRLTPFARVEGERVTYPGE